MEGKRMLNEENRYNSWQPPPLSPKKEEREKSPKEVDPEPATETPPVQKSFKIRWKTTTFKSMSKTIKEPRINGTLISEMTEEDKE